VDVPDRWYIFALLLRRRVVLTMAWLLLLRNASRFAHETSTTHFARCTTGKASRGGNMIGIPKTGDLSNAAISAVCFEGLTVTTTDGKQAKLAIIDEDGKIIESGSTVAREVWNVTLACYKNFLQGMGHLRVQASPPGQALLSRRVKD
jgi:hypothetical protein